MQATDQSRTALLTGVTRGLGRAMAEELALRGHRVLGCGRTREAIEELAGELGAPHDFAVVDVTHAGQVAAWARRLLASHPVPDLLLNSAGLINTTAPLWQVPPDEFSSVMDTNVKGTYHVLRSFLPAMLERGSGVVVNMSSTWGRTAAAGEGPYCASKWAVEGLTRALAQELPQGLAAVALNPGIIDTQMLRVCFGEGAASCWGPREWARRAVPFLLGLGPDHNGRSLDAPG